MYWKRLLHSFFLSRPKLAFCDVILCKRSERTLWNILACACLFWRSEKCNIFDHKSEKWTAAFWKAMFHIIMFWIWDNMGSVLGQKTLHMKLSSSQNSKWLILLNKTPELLFNRDILPVYHQNWRMPRISNCEKFGSVYGNCLHFFFTEFMQISVWYFNQELKSSWLTSEIRNFWSCFDVLLINISHFGSSKFLHVKFIVTPMIVHFCFLQCVFF